MPFVKGQSGNPSGRPKVTLEDGRSLQDIAREHTEEAVSVLIDIMGSETVSPRARVSAASAILDRAWGKASQAVELTGKDGGAIEFEQKVREDADVVTSAVASLAARVRAASVARSTQH